MGRAACCSKVGMRKGAWTKDEDMLLSNYVDLNGEGNWRSLPMKAGLRRCGKSCRLRWVNYLRPDIKRGCFSPEEDDLIIRLHSLLGARCSLISGRLAGRTDNDVENHWNTYLLKKLKATGIKPRARLYPPKAVKKNHHEGSSCEKTTTVAKKRRWAKKADNLLQQKKPEMAIVADTEVLVEKIRVHRSKAIKLSTSGYNCDSSSESSFQENEEKITPLSYEEVDYKKEEKGEEGFVPIIDSSSSLVIEEDNAKIKLFDELLNGSCDTSRQSSSCYMLNEVYKQYLQLLSEIGDIP